MHKNSSLLKLTLHILTWILLSLFPFFLSQSESVSIDYMRLTKYVWLPLLFYALIFYINYFILINHFLLKRRTLLFIISNIFLVLLFTWLHFEIKDLLNMIAETKPHLASGNIIPKKKPPLQYYIYKDFISMIIPMIIAYTVKTSERWAKIESEKKEEEKNHLKSELQNLKYQLQPHFFFNSLNTIYALIEKSPSLAQETVHSLGKLMRYMLYETEQGKVNLNEELEFMKQYIELMRLRLSDKTKVNVNFPAIDQTYEITPLLFISLIENAFKHGVSATHNSELYFSLAVHENKIQFIAENTNFPKNEKDKSGSGIGLVNLKKRLELSYPNHYSFTTKIVGLTFSVLLEINLNQKS
ncbi:sensor histidine kinase [Aurantibacillus circumpalustris]|uniref:sensor histidine kinase n=1 Tax=Aurantibacillus circumpalustris TaxID=3036359 RepID=UPI00295AD605|nr:histidine kinase [Aurantibacillus circumpalustris]